MTIKKTIGLELVELTAEPRIVDSGTNGNMTDYCATMYMVPITWDTKKYNRYGNRLIDAYINVEHLDLCEEFMSETILPDNIMID